jgi:hypothetical protein
MFCGFPVIRTEPRDAPQRKRDVRKCKDETGEHDTSPNVDGHRDARFVDEAAIRGARRKGESAADRERAGARRRERDDHRRMLAVHLHAARGRTRIRHTGRGIEGELVGVLRVALERRLRREHDDDGRGAAHRIGARRFEPHLVALAARDGAATPDDGGSDRRDGRHR